MYSMFDGAQLPVLAFGPTRKHKTHSDSLLEVTALQELIFDSFSLASLLKEPFALKD